MGATDSASRDATRPEAPRIGEVLAGKYRVEGVVGTGGMGIVVAALHLKLGQSVAIKLITADEAHRAEASMRLQREARAAARLRSDHVVRIHDVGMLDTGEPFIVMELLRGTDLATLIETEGALPIPMAVDYLLQACDAVAEAHAAGIVHRDLKPSNLFLTRRSDGQPLVKVLDFGISKAISPEGVPVEGVLTETRAIMGSPFYMSPEQVRHSKNVDARSDIWALGVILQEFLTAYPPFQADTFPAVCAAIAADPPVPVRALRPEVAVGLERVVLRCLEKSPAQRFQNVGELIQALRPFSQRSHGMTDPAPSPAARVGEFVRSVSPDAPTLSYEDSQRIVRQSVPSQPEIKPQTPAVALSTSQTRLGAKTPSNRARLVTVLLVAALLVAGMTALVLRPSPEQVATIAREPRFTLVIESSPSGADVLEGARRLGTTPLSLSIDGSNVAAESRTFVVRLAGYQPYTLIQGPSAENVRVVAALVPIAQLPAPVETAVAPADPQRSPGARPTPRARPRREPVVSPTPTPVPAPASDIRLER